MHACFGVGMLPPKPTPKTLHEYSFASTYWGGASAAVVHRETFFYMAGHASIIQRRHGQRFYQKPTYSVHRTQREMSYAYRITPESQYDRYCLILLINRW